MPTGTETSTAFLHEPRTLTRLPSRPNVSATRRSCSRAISNGFSCRCEAGASTEVTRPEYTTASAEAERKASDRRRTGLDRIGDEPQDVVARRQRLAARPPPREPERVP